MFIAIIKTRIPDGYFESSNIDYYFYEVTISEKILKDIDTIQSILYECQCIILLIDITNKESIKLLEQLMEDINIKYFKYLNIISTENKIDEKREIMEEYINNFIEKYKIKDNIKISVKEGKRIEELTNIIKQYVNYIEEEIPNNFLCKLDNIDNESQYIYKDYENIKNIEILILGKNTQEKQRLMLKLSNNDSKYSKCFLSTIGLGRIISIYKYRNILYKINLIDPPGQERYHSLPKRYFLDNYYFFILFDLTNKESFNDSSIWIYEIENNLNKKQINEKKIYLIGYNLDKLGRAISKEEAEIMVSFFGIKYFEISSRLYINIQEIIARVADNFFADIKERNENKKRYLFGLDKFINY